MFLNLCCVAAAIWAIWTVISWATKRSNATKTKVVSKTKLNSINKSTTKPVTSTPDPAVEWNKIESYAAAKRQTRQGTTWDERYLPLSPSSRRTGWPAVDWDATETHAATKRTRLSGMDWDRIDAPAATNPKKHPAPAFDKFDTRLSKKRISRHIGELEKGDTRPSTKHARRRSRSRSEIQTPATTKLKTREVGSFDEGDPYTSKRRSRRPKVAFEDVNMPVASKRTRNHREAHAKNNVAMKSKKYFTSSDLSTTDSEENIPVKLKALEGMSMSEALDELGRHESSFLLLVERATRTLIKDSRLTECTAIIARSTTSNYTTTYYWKTSGYLSRLKAMSQHKDPAGSLPTYKGRELDSWLSKPIIEKVEKLYLNYLESHGEVIGKHLVERLRNDPTACRLFAQQMSQTLLRVAEPFSEQLLAKPLAHLIKEQISNHTADELSRQLGDGLMYAGGYAAATSFTAALAHAFHGVILKIALKFVSATTIKGIMIGIAKIISHSVLGAVVMFLSAHLGLHLSSAAVGFVILPIAFSFTALELMTFKEKLAGQVAPEVRRVVAGRIKTWNRSALESVCVSLIKDGGKDICEALCNEEGLPEGATNAAREVLTAVKNRKVKL